MGAVSTCPTGAERPHEGAYEPHTLDEGRAVFVHCPGGAAPASVLASLADKRRKPSDLYKAS
jgi:hypothetical protein